MSNTIHPQSPESEPLTFEAKSVPKDNMEDQLHHHHAHLTPKLLFLVLSVSVGCWFAMGYAFTSTNTPQNVIVKWIRDVKCYRQGGPLDNAGNFSDFSDADVWCKPVEPEDESRMLLENSQLNTIWGIVGSAQSIGSFLGVWFCNILVGKYGNRRTLIWTNLLSVAGTVLSGLCVAFNSYEAFIIARILLGAHAAFCVAVVPMYIAEISPAHLRGTLGTIPGVTFQLGCLTTALLGLPQLFGSAELWPMVFWLRLIPALLLFATLPFCPESPRYLFLIQHNKSEAKHALSWLRGEDEKDVSEEMEEIQAEEQGEGSHESLSALALFRDPFLRRLSIVVIVLLLSNGFSCIAGIAIYSTSILQSAGLGSTEALYGTIGLMVIQVFSVFLSMVLLDRAGRKVLLLIANYGCVTCLFMMTISMSLVNYDYCANCRYGSLVALIAFMVCFNLGTSFVPWVLVSELYDQTSRAAAMMVGSVICHVMGMIVAMLFPIMQAAIEQWSFAIFAVLMLSCTVFLHMKLIETKGKDISQIQAELRRKLM